MGDILFGLGSISAQSFEKSKEEFLGLFSEDFLRKINPAKSVDESVVELSKLYKKYGTEKPNKTKEQE